MGGIKPCPVRPMSASLEFRLTLFQESVDGFGVVAGEEGQAFGSTLQATVVDYHVQGPFLPK